MLTSLPDTSKLNKDDNMWVRQDVDFDYNLWVDKMRHCLDSRNLYIFNHLMLGYDQREIGKALGCSHQAISQRVMKIKKQLQEKEEKIEALKEQQKYFKRERIDLVWV